MRVACNMTIVTAPDLPIGSHARATRDDVITSTNFEIVHGRMTGCSPEPRCIWPGLHPAGVLSWRAGNALQHAPAEATSCG
jgi:hypothetical protein